MNNFQTCPHRLPSRSHSNSFSDSALLIVDLQFGFVTRLAENRQQSFPQEILSTADKVRQRNMKIIHVAWGLKDDFFFYSHAATRKKDMNIILESLPHEYKLVWGLPSTDDLFIKGHDNSFASHIFAETLKRDGIRKLYACGLETLSCITKTFIGGLHDGFNIIGVLDLFGDSNEQIDNDGASNPLWHLVRLYERIGPNPLLNIVSKNEFLSSLDKKKPALPSRQTPASYLKESWIPNRYLRGATFGHPRLHP